MSLAIPDTGAVAKPASSSLVFKDPAALSLFSLGEETKINVIQRLSARQYLVAVKGRMVTADSAAPLKAGAELRVRVDKQHPHVLLRILSGMDTPRDLFSENIRLFRANPQALMTNLSQLEQLLAKAGVYSSVSPLIQDSSRLLLKSMATLRYSLNKVGDRNFLGDYPGNLGLLLESDLKKALDAKGERKLPGGGPLGGMKGLLLLLAEKIKASQADGSLPDETRGFLEQVQTSVDRSLKSIENQQIINVLLQETEHTHLLQLPFLFPEGMKLGEIFIRSDDHDAGSAQGERTFTVELLLELDVLGHLLVNVRMQGKKLECVCKCGNEDVSEFISPHLPELQDQLLAAGYRVERLTCVTEQDVEEQKAAWHRQYLIYSGESINIFA